MDHQEFSRHGVWRVPDVARADARAGHGVLVAHRGGRLPIRVPGRQGQTRDGGGKGRTLN